LALAILLALMVGVMQFLMGAFRLGFLVNFLSQPVINGFTSAAAIIIGLSQVKHLFNVNFQGSQQVHIVLIRLMEQLPNMHWQTLIIGLSGIAFLMVLKKKKPSWPGALIGVILSTLSVWFFDLHKMGISIVGDVPEGLPALQIPDWNWAIITDMIPIAFTIALISFMEAIAVAKKFASKEGYKVDPNQELIALGVCNTGAGLFGGYPIAGSFSRTAVNAHAGARTTISSFFNALTIALTLVVLTPLFYYMPKAILAAIVIVAVIGLIDTKEPVRLYKLRKKDFLSLLFAFIVTLLLGARMGVLLSAIASVVLIIYRISYPNVAVLGRKEGTKVFRNTVKYPDYKELDHLMILRIDASLYYANAGYMKDKVIENLMERPETNVILIESASVNEIDATAMATIFELLDELRLKGIKLYFSDLKSSLRDIFEKSGFNERLGEDHFYIRREDFIEDFESGKIEVS
jgi:SulP family sulfate permease